ncbi:putative transmembrane protein [Rhodopirellula islandica]|uniref:Transmembrane protein n=2 Tax=Rhodopirellula islandica TaxID=595434 RepID=A0A0J1BHH3_RHOIS|nr:putative transmembrane protein [Rhodopirellula islandica]
MRMRLWWIAISPTVWAIHFLASYITAAIWCEKMMAGNLRPLQFSVAIYTAIALPAIGWVGWASYRNFRRGDPPVPYDFDDPTDRTHFLGFTAFLLSVLSVVATLFTALVFVLIGSCD